MAIKGLTALQKRFAAIKDTRELLNETAKLVLAEAHKRAPHKTGNLRRSILITGLSATGARIVVNANYGRWVEEGTGIYGPRKHVIVPTTKKALAWTSGTYGAGGSLRLSGSARKGKAGAGASMMVRRSVKGRRATPYFRPAVEAAISRGGVGNRIVAAWNGAA